MSLVSTCGVTIGRVLLKLARGQALARGELEEAAIANGRMVKWDIDREARMRRRALAQDIRAAERRQVARVLRRLKTGYAFQSATASTEEIARITGLSVWRVRVCLQELRAEEKKAVLPMAA